MPPSPINEAGHSGVDREPAMAAPLYIPVLPTRRDAWNAYAQLELGVRQRIAPLWTVVPRVGPERPRGTTLAPDPDNDRERLHHWLTLRLDHVINVMAGLAGWVDTAHAESLLDASAPSLWRLATGSAKDGDDAGKRALAALDLLAALVPHGPLDHGERRFSRRRRPLRLPR
ncbi:hypothetical protein [Streptomyces caniferus]|uniref:hypothetical protein n=1 Tax=Streptomyces caniferus TaxID=285557 RepID=UPI0037FA247C